MKLSQRLKQAANPAEARQLAEDAAAGDPPVPEAPEEAAQPRVDPFARLKLRAQQALFARLGSRLYDPSLTEAQLHGFVGQELTQLLDAEQAPLSAGERQQLVAQIANDVLGYGPIQVFLEDPTVTEVMVNGTRSIYVERLGKIQSTESRFASDEHLRRVIERIVAHVGRRIDESSPMVDARLPDGSRVNVIIPPLAIDGAILTIRKFAKDPYQVGDLVEFGTMTKPMAQLLQACVDGRLNIIVSGGTGTGKTTLLNVISSFLPHDQRIVTIEDAAELQLHQDHVIRLESRPPNIEGKGAITIRDLVRNALRMRPDRIVVGEARGAEALDMLQAMNTGHEGSLSTVHANSPRDVIARLETMVLMAGFDLPVRAIREQIASAIDVIVHLTRMRDGTRRITHVTEVTGMEGQIITLQDVFLFDYAAGMDEQGMFRGSARPTGLRPQFSEKLEELGIDVPASIFGAPQDVLARNRG